MVTVRNGGEGGGRKGVPSAFAAEGAFYAQVRQTSHGRQADHRPAFTSILNQYPSLFLINVSLAEGGKNWNHPTFWGRETPGQHPHEIWYSHSSHSSSVLGTGACAEPVPHAKHASSIECILNSNIFGLEQKQFRRVRCLCKNLTCAGSEGGRITAQADGNKPKTTRPGCKPPW